MSLNKAIIIGHLGADPEVRYSTAGQPVTNLRVATNEAWTDKQGQKQERTEWHRVVVWGKLAEVCGEYLRKGRQVAVEGALQTREHTDKEGQRRFTTEIVASNVQFLGGGDARGERGGDARGERGAEARGERGAEHGGQHSAPQPSPGPTPRDFVGQPDRHDTGGEDIPF